MNLESKKEFSPLTKLVLIALTLAAVAFGLWSLGVFGDTTIGLTLNTNPALKDGLILHWTLDGTDLTSNVADRSGNAYTGYLSGFVSTTTAFGKIGQALEFDGTDDFASTTISDTVRTVAFWAKPNSLNEPIIELASLGSGYDESNRFFAAGAADALFGAWRSAGASARSLLDNPPRFTSIAFAQSPRKPADLIVALENGGSFERGDVIHAFTEAHNLNVHAWNAVKPETMPRANGRIVSGALLETYFDATKEFKFERISETEIRKTNLWTNESYVIGPTPNSKGEHMDVPLYLERRLSLKPGSNLIFGEPGSEYWYGGGERITDATMDAVWDSIEARTSARRSTEFPFTEREKEKYLVLKANLTREEAQSLVEPQVGLDVEGNEVQIKERARKIDIDALLTPGEKVQTGIGIGRALQAGSKDLRGAVRAVNILQK